MGYQNRSRPKKKKDLIIDAVFDLTDLKDGVSVDTTDWCQEDVDHFHEQIDFIKETLKLALKKKKKL